MLTIKMKGRDGSSFHEEISRLDEAIRHIEGLATGLADFLWTGDWGNVFPLYWQVIRNEDRELIASGHVDEYGCML